MLKFPKNYPYPQQPSYDAFVRFTNNFTEFFGVEIEGFKLKQSLYVGSFQQKSARWFGTPCIYRLKFLEQIIK